MQGHDPKFANRANNHLLVSIGQAFGVDANTFGTGVVAAGGEVAVPEPPRVGRRPFLARLAA